MTPNLPRAQAVVEGCRHTLHGTTGLLREQGGFVDGACAPCLVAYAEQVRGEERERCAKTLEQRAGHIPLCFDVPKSAEMFVVKQLQEAATTLRTEAGEPQAGGRGGRG